MPYQFPGRTLRQKQVSSFRITETSYAPNSVLPLHQHESAYISFLLAGGYCESVAARDTHCLAGTVLFHPPRDAHADHFAPTGGHMVNLEIHDAWWQDASQEFRPATATKAFQNGRPFAGGLRLYRSLKQDQDQLDDLALELVSFFFNGPADRKPPLTFLRALDFIHQSHEKPISLAETARHAAVHPVYLARSFQRFLGCTFGEHVNKLRLQRSLQLLRSSEKPITEIAHACGFADHAHLCRSFKLATGFTPSGFRRHIG